MSIAGDLNEAGIHFNSSSNAMDIWSTSSKTEPSRSSEWAVYFMLPLQACTRPVPWMSIYIEDRRRLEAFHQSPYLLDFVLKRYRDYLAFSTIKHHHFRHHRLFLQPPVSPPWESSLRPLRPHQADCSGAQCAPPTSAPALGTHES